MKTDRIIFFGTPEFAVPCLEALQKNKRNVILAVTQPDQPAGRGKKLTAPPVKQYCDANGIPCIQPKSVKSKNFLNLMYEQKADLFIIVAFGRIFSQALLDVVPLSLNVHASLLPKWRGASPISQSILHGDEKSGVSIMKLVEELDAGPYILQKSIPIDENDNTQTLTTKLSELGAEALLESIDKLSKDEFKFTEQDASQSTYAPILNVEDAHIDWKKSAIDIQRHIRAYAPSPGAHTSDGTDRIKIYKSKIAIENANGNPGQLIREKKKLTVVCGKGALELVELQRPGKTKQGIVDFLNGYPMDRKQWN